MDFKHATALGSPPKGYGFESFSSVKLPYYCNVIAPDYLRTLNNIFRQFKPLCLLHDIQQYNDSIFAAMAVEESFKTR